MLFIFLVILSIANSTYAQTRQFELTQSTPGIQWETISNDYVEVIYPNYLKSESVYIANLVEHYSKYVGLTYEIQKPKKFPLIIRPEMGDPNGFVTLAPRRSEWYSNSSFSSFVGSSEWYQTLSIHEYRHVNQFDNTNRSTVKGLRYLFGDMGQLMGIVFSGMQPWYLEGDAVWAETKYTDAGRGRSPMFMARLKALVINNKIPTYDEFVNGTYNNKLPNHYVFGYALISYATTKFGEDVWKKVVWDMMDFPHPRRFYGAFERVTGQDFMDFYAETMNDLQQKWGPEKNTDQKIEDYHENIYPFKSGKELYHLTYDMNSYWSLHQGNKKIVEIPFFKELNQFHVSKDKAVYSQFLPNKRYGYKGSSDIILIDIKSKKQKKITSGQRYYSPRLNYAADKILTTEFTQDHQWVITELNLLGEKIRSVKLDDHIIAEVYPAGTDQAFAIIADKRGYKSLVEVNLASNTFKTIIGATRNNLFSLNVDIKGNIFFEAQYKGYVNIFGVDSNGNLMKCTDAKIMANSPSSDGETIYFSNVDASGSSLSAMKVADCKVMDKASLENFNYLGQGPSDNYNNFPLKEFPEQTSLYGQNTQRYKPKTYSSFTKELFIPHSWGFVSGRGFEATAKTDNYLRTMGLNAKLGRSSEEGENYTEFSFDLKKYYPLISFFGALRDRDVDLRNSKKDLTWKEEEAGVDVLVPYVYRYNLFTSSSGLRLGGSYVEADNFDIKGTTQSRDDQFLHKNYIGFDSLFAKDLYARSIISPWSIGYSLRYENAKAQSDDDFSSYRFYQNLGITIPGLFTGHGLSLIAQQEKQSAMNDTYRFLPVGLSPTGYIFSRGYTYESTEQYQKLSANYIFPLATPDLNLAGWYYLRRVTNNLYFDTTRIEDQGLESTLNSFGTEVEFESKILRILPINLGLRYINQMKTGSNSGEIYTNFTGMF